MSRVIVSKNQYARYAGIQNFTRHATKGAGDGISKKWNWARLEKRIPVIVVEKIYIVGGLLYTVVLCG
jgi:hypothetical protein